MASIIKANKLQDFAGNELLTSDGSGNFTLQDKITTNNSGLLKMTPAFQASLGSTLALTDATLTLLSASVESYDSDGCYNNTGSTVTLNGISTPSYAFAPNVAGKYQLNATLRGGGDGSNTFEYALGKFYKNGSVLTIPGTSEEYTPIVDHRANNGANGTISMNFEVELNGTSDYVQCYFFVATSSPNSPDAHSLCTFGAHRIIGA